MTDANQGYTLEVGLDAAAAFADCGVFWLEEPLFVEDITGHAQLREKGVVPIAVGENLNMCYAFENFVLRGAVDYLQPDVARAGGITEIKKIAATAAVTRRSDFISHLGRRGRPCRQRPFICCYQRMYRHGTRLHL
jgi:L-alanine-DL-glutamate epimerase-like enolase superfamily enzyme